VVPYRDIPLLQECVHHLFVVWEGVRVVLTACLDNAARLIRSVHVGYLASVGIGVRCLLIGKEVVLDPVDNLSWALGEIFPLAIGGVSLEHCEDLIVCLSFVYHPEPTYGYRLKQDVAMSDGALREDTDIKWITVPYNLLPTKSIAAQLGDLISTVGLRDESIEGRADIGVSLRSINTQYAGLLVGLILHRVGRYDLDVGSHCVRSLTPNVHTVPRVRLEQAVHKFQ